MNSTVRHWLIAPERKLAVLPFQPSVERIMNHSTRIRLFLSSAIFGLALGGCGGGGDNLPREPVWGNVTLDGKPLSSGQIEFVPSANAGGQVVAASGEIKDGQYSIPRESGPTPGTYTVSIYSTASTEASVDASDGPGKAPVVAKNTIPTKYNSNSKLAAEIKEGGRNTFTYDLESK
jgi:hypothetical protein